MDGYETGWSQVELAGHACWCFEPETPSAHDYVVIYLHSSRGERLAEQTLLATSLARRGFRILCPIAGETWWADRIVPSFDESLTPERFVVEHVAPYAQERWNAEPPQLALTGHGMGGQGALRISYKHPSLFPVVAAIAPTIDFHLRMRDGDAILGKLYRDVEQARQDTALLHIHPLNWPRHQWFCCDPADYDCWEGGDRLRMKLASIGILFEYDIETTADGDGATYIDKQAEPAAAFLWDRLERERLRIV